MSDRWGDSKRDRDDLNRWITQPMFDIARAHHAIHTHDPQIEPEFQLNRVVYVGTFPDGSQLMVTRWVDQDGEDVRVEAATRPLADPRIVWGAPTELEEPA